MHDEIWILGATGRVGRAVAARMRADGLPVVLVGRDRARLDAVAAGLSGDARVVVATLDEALAAIEREGPAVVVNTIGPFAATTPRVIRACPTGTHYVDVSNELDAVAAVLDTPELTTAADRTLVVGAGFGVYATESALLHLCADRPPAERVRVDALASVENEAGVVGAALAASILDGLAKGGREVHGGRLVRARLGAGTEHLITPDGARISTGSAPSGELLAAWRASGAGSVVAASGFAPTAPLARAAMPVVSAILRVGAIRRFAIRRVGGVEIKPKERPREFSWARARAEWSGGEVRTAWLRAGDAMDFTVSVTAEVTRRLAAGSTPPGAYTPGSLFGPSLATDVGGEFVPG